MAQDATRSGVEGLNGAHPNMPKEAKEGKGVDAYKEFLRRIRFDDKSDKPNGARGIATRAMRRDLQETGLLPTGHLSLIKEFATGE